jgi:hypothetical protein
MGDRLSANHGPWPECNWTFVSFLANQLDLAAV